MCAHLSTRHSEVIYVKKTAKGIVFMQQADILTTHQDQQIRALCC